jgi:ectoine hydroxylase-related dioxygenase (phytanoyl-CoA dioxygenase family)
MNNIAEPIRPVTDDEVKFFHTNGYVNLRGLVDPEAVASMYDEILARMGPDGSEFEVRKGLDFAGGGGFTYRWPRNDIDIVAKIAGSNVLGETVAKLLGRNVPIRLYDDAILTKMSTSVRAERGGASPYHQDSLGANDRTGLVVWIALHDMEPEIGTMRFLEKSQQLGPQGRWDIPMETALSMMPYLKNYKLTPPNTMKAGDATVHTNLTVHGAPPNTSDRTRFAYRLNYFPADARYTSHPHAFTDRLGLSHGDVIDSERFDYVYQPA